MRRTLHARATVSGKKELTVQRLAQLLASKSTIGRRVTLLPDIAIDQIITIPNTPRKFLSEANRILRQGGGNYLGIKAQLRLGGCAANCAATLSRLKAPVSFLGRTSKLGRELISLSADSRYLDLSRLKTDGTLAITAALELRLGRGLANLMLTEPGSAGNFAQRNLSRDDYELLARSFIVGVFSWNLNEHGTDLLGDVARFAKDNSIRIYADLGDPTPRLRALPRVIERVLRQELVNWLSVNENELRCLASCLRINGWKSAGMMQLAQDVSAQLGLEIDFHSETQAGIAGDNLTVSIPTFDVSPIKTTGAGDAWNAGNIYGLVRGTEPRIRLMMANLTAAAALTSDGRRRLSLESVARFLRRIRLRAS